MTIQNIIAGFVAGASAGLIVHFLVKNSYLFENLFDFDDSHEKKQEKKPEKRKEEEEGNHKYVQTEKHARLYHKSGHPVKPRHHTRHGEAEFFPSNNEFARFEHRAAEVIRPDNLAI